MKAKLFKTCPSKNSKYDIVAINVDEYGVKHLERGHPLRIAFFTDDKLHLPDYKRDIMVIEIGQGIDLQKQECIYKDRKPREALIDKSYLLTSFNEIRMSVCNALFGELKKLGFDVPNKQEIIDIEPRNDLKEVACDQEYLNLNEVSEMLKVSRITVKKFVKNGLLPAELNVYLPGWGFSKKDIKDLLRQKPEFLKSAWRRSKLAKVREKKRFLKN